MTTDRAGDRQENEGRPGAWPDDLSAHPAFTGGPMPTGNDAPLEGELVCVCGQLEGLHRADGCCEISGCSWFVAADEHEEETRPDVRIEYDAGQEPR